MSTFSSIISVSFKLLMNSYIQCTANEFCEKVTWKYLLNTCQESMEDYYNCSFNQKLSFVKSKVKVGFPVEVPIHRNIIKSYVNPLAIRGCKLSRFKLQPLFMWLTNYNIKAEIIRVMSYFNTSILYCRPQVPIDDKAICC